MRATCCKPTAQARFCPAHMPAPGGSIQMCLFLFRSAGRIQSDAQPEARGRSEQRPETRSNWSALCGLQTFQRSRETIVSMDTNAAQKESQLCT